MSKTVTVDVPEKQFTDIKLKEISDLGLKQLELEHKIKAKTVEIELLAASLHKLKSETLPDAMAEVGMSEFKLLTGEQIKVVPFYSVKIPDEQRDEAFKWFRDNGHADMIKRNISCFLPAGNDKLADRIIKGLLKLSVVPEDKQTVHPQTLKSFVREMTEDGKPLPHDLLGVYVGRVTKVTPAK